MANLIDPGPSGPNRVLVKELRELGHSTAPASLLPAVMARLGLGDGYWTFESHIGQVFVAFNKEGVSTLRMGGENKAFEAWFKRQYNRPAYPVVEPPAGLKRDIMEVLGGAVPSKLAFDLRGVSEFERKVLLKALEIPRGEVRPYGWVAQEIGNPGAVRAVGSALGRNPVPLLIPCHRVVRSDGQVGGYIFGNEVKKSVLAGEGLVVESLEELGRAGTRYFGNPSNHTFCFPTCREARQIPFANRLPLSSEALARSKGYTPCEVCRPALLAS